MINSFLILLTKATPIKLEPPPFEIIHHEDSTQSRLLLRTLPLLRCSNGQSLLHKLKEQGLEACRGELAGHNSDA
jgi:hypothetical protein